MPSQLLADKIAAIEAVAECWNRADINYAVAHGVEGYPARIGRDLDVLVDARQIDHALTLAEAAFRNQGWRVARPPAIWGKRLLAFADTGVAGALEVHTVSVLSWRNVTLANQPAPTGWIGPFKVDPWVSFAKRVLAPILAGNLRRFVRNPEQLYAADDELRAAVDRLPTLFGSTLARTLTASIRDRDLKRIQALSNRLRSAAMLRSGTFDPIRSLSLGAKSIRRRLIQPFHPCAPVIALVGPDGVGKSTTLEALRQSDGHVFLDIIVRHWRPALLPSLATLVRANVARSSADGLLPPRRHPGRLPLIRLLYYYVDFLIGGLVRDRLASSRQCLVLYDRCFLDMAVDPLRFGLASPRGTTLCWRWLPKPDRIILLCDDPARIHARKPELPEEEIQAQLDEWQRRAASRQVHAVIAVQGSTEQIADRIWAVINDAFIEKNGGTLPERIYTGRK